MNWIEKARLESQPSLTEVYEALLLIADKQNAGSALKEILNEAVFKTASTRHTLREEASDIKRQYLQLAEDSSPDYARKVLFAKVSETSRINTSTPHPTQPLSDEAIDAVLALDKVLLTQAQNLYDGIPLAPIDEQEIKNAIRNLDVIIAVPVTKSLEVREEMARDRRLSLRNVEAIPLMVETILKSTDVSSSSILTDEELDNFSHLLESKSWSGDMDGKPLVTPELLQEGIDLIQQDRHDHFKKLLVAFDNPELDKIIKRLDEADYNTAQLVADLKPLRRVLSVAVNPDKPVTAFDNIILQAMSSHKVQIRQNRLMHEKAFAEMIRMVEGEEAHPKTITKEYIEAFIERISEDVAYRDEAIKAVEARLTSLKESLPPIAQRITAIEKQANERKQGVTSESVGADNFAWYQQHFDPYQKDYGFYQTMESLGIAAKNPDKIGEVIIAECGSTEDLMRGFALMELMKQSRNREAEQNIELIPLTEYPERVLEVRDLGTGKVTIPAVEMIMEALENPHFLKHQLSIKNSEYLLRNYGFDIADIERSDNTRDRLTVADVKKRYGIELEEQYNDVPLIGTMTVMFAGSDMTRVGGQAAKVACDAAIDELRKEMLKKGILLVPYKGLGSGVSRSNPGNANVTTGSQGRKMVETREEVAGNTLRNLGMNVDQALYGKHTQSHSPSYREEVTLRLLNMGNMVNLPEHDTTWHSETKPRIETMIATHEEFFKTPSFSSLVSCATPPVTETSFAARAMKRPQAGQENNIVPFPPPMDVQQMRAIGYQAALNASGLCSSLYYGASDLLKSHKDGMSLKEIFMKDPKAENALNTAIYGVIMADMDIAEQYARNSQQSQEAFDKIREEYNQTSGQLLQLVAELTGKRSHTPKSGQLSQLWGDLRGKKVDKTLQGKEAAGALLEMLPSALKQELTITLANVKSASQTLVNVFNQVQSGELAPEDIKRVSELYESTIYPAMVTIMTAFERSPAAYLNHTFAMEVENHQKQGMPVASR